MSRCRSQVKDDSHSFKIGSVRALDDQIPLSVWRGMQKFISNHFGEKDQVTCIGTGGNISKIFELSKPSKKTKFISPSKIEEIKGILESYPLEERIHKLNINPDRADVIIPVSKIYLAAMTAAGSKKMLVPDIGLKDGLMQVMYKENRHKKF